MGGCVCFFALFYMNVYAACMSPVPEVVRARGTGVKDGCEPPCECSESCHCCERVLTQISSFTLAMFFSKYSGNNVYILLFTKYLKEGNPEIVHNVFVRWPTRLSSFLNSNQQKRTLAEVGGDF